ncbi:MAG: peptidoglycan DD-metalloendopeptidase family protein [Myxococcota bacterium]
MRRFVPFVVCLAVAFPANAQYGFGPDPGRLAASQRDVESKRSERDRLAAEIDGIEERSRAAKLRVRNRMRTLYRLSRSGMLPLAGGFEALLRHQARVNRLEQMVADDLGALEDLERRVALLRTDKATVEAELRAAEEQLATLQTVPALPVAPAVAPWEPSYQSPADYRSPSGYGTLRLVDEPGRGLSAESFASQRGHLSMPVAGSVDVREGRREDGIGLEFLASPGAAVRAVSDGRVAFAQHYSGYGMLVILDHGEGYFSVYGGLGTTHVTVGDYIYRGRGLGTVGPDGRLRGLYFEVRRGTRSLDAPSWLGL